MNADGPLQTLPQTLPAAWYVDEAVYRRERERIFARNWWLFGPAAELSEPGAYRAMTLCGWPLFVIRGTDGVLRGFHNVCRHRAAALLPEGAGACRVIRCPYHCWTYETDGRLKTAPKFGDDPGFQPADYGLFPIRVETWRDLIFVCMDAAAPDLRSWLGAADRLCQDFPTPAALDYHGCFTVEGAANWKTYCDNTVEGYHLPFVHPRLSKSVRGGTVEIRAYDEGRTIAFHVGYGATSDGATLRGAEGLWIYKYPAFQLVAGVKVFKAERIEPLGPGGLRSTNWSWYGDLPQDQRDDAFAWARQIVEEDLGICETVQINLEAGVYQVGRLSPDQERHVARFQDLVRTALRDEAPPT